MKKLVSLILAMLMVAALAVPALAEDALVYGTATLTYAEFYSGDVSSTDSLDAVSSATTGKSGTFANTVSDFVDEATNKDGYHLTGIANVNVAVAAADVDAYKALNPTFAESAEAPAQYKPVTLADGAAVYGATVFNVADTVSDAQLEVATDSHWGDYQINVLETSTQYIRNSREDAGFAVNSEIMGVIVETESGLKVGMEHLQSIWVQPWEISWNVSVDNSHNSELAYDNLEELDKLMGEKIVKVTFVNQNDAYVYTFDGAYLPIKLASSLSVDDARSADGKTALTVTGLADDYAPAYAVNGLDIDVADGQLTWTADVPGAYTLTLSDESGVYAPMSAAFVLSTDVLPVTYDADLQELALADGADEAMKDAFIANLSTVSVNDVEYSASGRGAVVIINSIGELDADAAVTQGRGQDAVETPIFPESGEYEIVVKAVGFDNALTFTANIEK